MIPRGYYPLIILLLLFVGLFLCEVGRLQRTRASELQAAETAQKKPDKEEKKEDKKPVAPKDFQTVVFTIQVTMTSRKTKSEIKTNLSDLCRTMKGNAGVAKATPTRAYGVYLHDGKPQLELILKK